MSLAQEKLLGVIEDEAQANILANVWQMIEGSPLQAAKVIRALEQSHDAVLKITADIPEAWRTLDEQCVEADVRRAQFIEDLRVFRKESVTELTAVMTVVGQLKDVLDQINENDVLNKANRLLELAERFGRARRDGSLDMLKNIFSVNAGQPVTVSVAPAQATGQFSK